MNSIKQCRELAGLTQKEVAIALKISVQSVSYWETGERTPSLDNAVALCELFHCSMNKLLGLAESGAVEKKPPAKGEGLKEKVVNRLDSLSPAQLQRVDDFLSGIELAQKEP